MPKTLGGADPAAVAAVAVVRRRSAAALRRGKPARRKRATTTTTTSTTTTSTTPARVTVSAKGRPRVLPASAVGRCGLTALGGWDVEAAAPRVHALPAPVAGEAVRTVDGVWCVVDTATGRILESVVFYGPKQRRR